jgi:hypothetical protein
MAFLWCGDLLIGVDAQDAADIAWWPAVETVLCPY